MKSEANKQAFSIEPLENRTLLHGVPGLAGFGFAAAHVDSTIEFSQAPSAVQSGLGSLATQDGQTAPASDSTQTVYLGNGNGVETYTMIFRSSGTVTRITVDEAGNAVTPPTRTTTTFGELDSAVSDEISAIATALNLTAAASDAKVIVSTPADGSAAIYSVRLARSSGRGRALTVTVDANGNPVGNQNVPFSAVPAAIQSGLNDNAPSGATPIDTTSTTELVQVRTVDGVTLYSISFTTTGTQTKVTVDSTGALASLPSRTTAEFSTIPEAAQSALQALADAEGSTDDISSTATATEFHQANGTVIYAVTVPITTTDDNGDMHTRSLTLAVDASGNPTVPPMGQPIFATGAGIGCGADGSVGAGSSGGGGSTGTTTTSVRGSNSILRLRR